MGTSPIVFLVKSHYEVLNFDTWLTCTHRTIRWYVEVIVEVATVISLLGSYK